MELETLSKVAKWTIGIGFLWIPIWLAWLYTHRRSDWPKAWTLLLVGVGMAACGASRIAHALLDNPDSNKFTVAWDCFTAIVIVMVDLLLPWALLVIRSLPTPKEWEHAQRAKLQRDQLSWMIEEERRSKEQSERRNRILIAILSQTPLSPELKAEIEDILKEVPK